MIILDHTIVPARDREASARFFADVFGVPLGTGAHAPVQVNDSLVFDFDNRPDSEIPRLHYAFRVDGTEFDAILSRLKERGVPYGSPPTHDSMEVRDRGGARSFFFHDPNGHSLEVMTG